MKNYMSKNHEEIVKDHRFDWYLAQNLASYYSKPLPWITRSILACRNTNTPVDHFIGRYLKKEDLPFNSEFVAESARLQKHGA